MDKTIVFADFDGTILMEDTLVGVIRLFVDDEEFHHFNNMLAAGEITLSEVVRLGFDRTPSDQMPKILDYVRSVPIRPGFETFLDTCQELGIPVVVISGGMREFVELKMAPYRDKIRAIHAVEMDTSGPTIQLISNYDDGNELLKKTDVMKLYQYEQAIGIGDSFTDMNMAQAVDTIFARDVLAKYLTKLGKPFIPYEDFYTVAEAIRSSR